MKSSKNRLSEKRNIRILADMLKPIQGLIWGIVFAVAAKAGVQLGIPILTKVLVDKLPTLSPGSLALIALGYVALATATVLFSFIEQILSTKANGNTVYNFRMKLIQRVLQDTEYASTMSPSGNYISLLSNDIPLVGAIYGSIIPRVAFNFIRLFGALIALGILESRLLIIAPFILLLYSFFPILTNKIVSQISKDLQDKTGELMGMASEYIQGRRHFIVMNSSAWALNRFSLLSNQALSKAVRLANFSIIPSSSYFLLWLTYGLAYFVGGIAAIQGRLSIGEMLALASYIGYLSFPMSEIIDANSDFTKAMGALTRINNELAASQKANDTRNLDCNSLQTPIRLENLSVWYDKSQAISDVSLLINPGEQIAIVGSSGSGKSTLLSTITQLTPLTDGRIIIGDKDIAEINLYQYRNRLGCVFEDTPIIQGSLEDNIAFGNMHVKVDEIINYIDLAGATDLLVRTHEKSKMMLSEGGKELSSGQRQRIGLARALIRKPDVLILDEATSALDAISERQLFESIRKKFPSITIIVVTHRLATIQFSNNIIVLENGLLVETGTHDALMKQKGVYANLVKHQYISDNQ